MNPELSTVLARLARDPGLSAFVRGQAAVMLISGDGAHVLHGNDAGLAMGQAGFSARTVLQFAKLAGGLAPGNGVRLEQIELPTLRGNRALTCACRRIRTDDGTVVLLIAAQDRQHPDDALATPAVKTMPDVSEPLAEPQEHAVPARQAAVSENALVFENTSAPDTFTESPASPLPQALAEKVRFIWEMDGDGVIAAPPREIVTAFGRETADAFGGETWDGKAWNGKTWAEVSRTIVHDPGNVVASALNAGKTFSGLDTFWRLSGTDDAFKVTMSGLPLHGSTRALTGWRGFGIIDTRQIVPFAPAQFSVEKPDPGTALRQASELPPRATDAVATVQGQPDDGMPELYPAQRTLASARSEQPTEAVLQASAVHQPAPTNVVQIRPHDPALRLTSSERNAFREIAKALGARIEGDEGGSEQASANHDASANRDARDGHDINEGHGTVAFPDFLPEAALPLAVSDDMPDDMEVAAAPDVSDPAVPASHEPVVHLVPAAPPRDDMFMALLDKLPIGILVLKAERISYANRTLIDLLDHDSVDDLLDMGTERLFRGPAPSEGGGVFSLTRRDGSFEAVDARLSAITWNGTPATLMSFRRALETGDTARADADAARADALKLDLDKAQAQARELIAILDTATDGVATVDDRGRILSLNKSAEALFGYDQREVTGENFTLLLAPESHITALDYLEGLKGGGVAALLNDGREVAGRVRQGGRIPLSMTMGRVADGPDKKYSAVLRDMTAWKRAEADLVEARRQAERASAQKSDVLAKISHEIRTPLNAILGFTEVMSEERFGPIGNERYKEYLGDIHQSGGYLISLINDLLDLAKIEAGKMDLTFVGVNLNDIAASSVALLQPEANRQRVVLRTGLQPKLPAVVADDRSLRQIVINVLSNAVKFTDAGGQVIVSTALGDRGEVILRVRDTGVGMSEKELALAMEPFRQVSATRRGNGTGLGLPITKALVEANKGALLITSAKNEGTLVEITFPPQRVLAS